MTSRLASSLLSASYFYFQTQVQEAGSESAGKEDSKSQDITKLLKYVCNTRKIARKEDNDVYISSQTECTVKISDFAAKQDFMGTLI